MYIYLSRDMTDAGTKNGKSDKEITDCIELTREEKSYGGRPVHIFEVVEKVRQWLPGAIVNRPSCDCHSSNCRE